MVSRGEEPGAQLGDADGRDVSYAATDLRAGEKAGVTGSDHAPLPDAELEPDRSNSPRPPRPGTTGTPFRIVDRARWSDVDAAGIVCYGAYLRFFELAETELFRASGMTVADIQQHFGLWLVRRRVECDFYRSILLDEEVEVLAHVVAIGRTSIQLAFLARRLGEREIAVEARYIVVAVDHQELRPIPVPEPVRTALGPWVMDREAVRLLIGTGEG